MQPVPAVEVLGLAVQSDDGAMARILVVEDERVSLELIAALLASRGHEVEMAEDGFGALRLARETTFDIAFVDYHLPEMDGYALARLMRSLSDTADGKLKMVAITADRCGLAARRGVDTIFDHVLTKPIRPDALFAMVDEFLGTGGGAPNEGLASFLVGQETSDDAGLQETCFDAVRRYEAHPSARVFPPPSQAERESLQRCFRIVDQAASDCLVLLRLAGLPALETLRAQGDAWLAPLVVLDPKLAPIADAAFKIGDARSWSEAKTVLSDFAVRTRGVATSAVTATDFDTRLVAYLFAAARPLVFCRDETGRLSVPYTAGFSIPAMIEAVKRLASRGLIAARNEVDADKQRRLVVTLTAKGVALAAEPDGELLLQTA